VVEEREHLLVELQELVEQVEEVTVAELQALLLEQPTLVVEAEAVKQMVVVMVWLVVLAALVLLSSDTQIPMQQPHQPQAHQLSQ
jgi:hypothetical protein